MSKQTEHLAADLELWADRIEDRRRFVTPDEMNCAAIMRLAAQMLTERKPLTKEQIYKIWGVTMFTDNGKHANLENQPFVHLARAIEKAHGIV